MIYKGLVEVVLNAYQVKVRIPFIHKSSYATSSTSSEDLPTAVICTFPSSSPNLQPGDVVIIGFENNDLSKPVILGHLYTESESNTFGDLVLNSLEVINSSQLSRNTSIGDISPSEISYLHGVRDSIQHQIDCLNEKIENLEEKINDLILK